MMDPPFSRVYPLSTVVCGGTQSMEPLSYRGHAASITPPGLTMQALTSKATIEARIKAGNQEAERQGIAEPKWVP